MIKFAIKPYGRFIYYFRKKTLLWGYILSKKTKTEEPTGKF